MKTKISIDEIIELKNRIREINKISFHDIVFTSDGVELEFSEGLLEDWLYTGLSNVDFIDSGYYLAEK